MYCQSELLEMTNHKFSICAKWHRLVRSFKLTT